MSRAAEVLQSIPIGNLIIMGIITLVFAYQTIFDVLLIQYTMCPRNVIYAHEYFRIVTSSLFHGGMMHFAMNMMSTAAIGSALERRFGTLRHIFTILWGILLTSLIYLSAAMGLYWLFGVEGPMYQHSVGFSCVIFQLSVIEANLSPDSVRSVFGFVRVPSYVYPWALLLVIQVIMPHISFMGHLSGILVGTLQMYKVLDWLMPSNDFLREMEKWSFLQFVTSKPSYVAVPPDSVLDALGQRGGPFQLLMGFFGLFGTLCRFIKHVLETLKVIIFGYGHHREERDADWAEDDDIEWVDPRSNAPTVDNRLV